MLSITSGNKRFSHSLGQGRAVKPVLLPSMLKNRVNSHLWSKSMTAQTATAVEEALQRINEIKETRDPAADTKRNGENAVRYVELPAGAYITTFDSKGRTDKVTKLSAIH